MLIQYGIDQDVRTRTCSNLKPLIKLKKTQTISPKSPVVIQYVFN